MSQQQKSLSAAPESAAHTVEPEPLPIWFFVGIILGVYGVLVVIAGLVSGETDTVLGHTRPALWWGAVLVAVGYLFVAISRPGPDAAEYKGPGRRVQTRPPSFPAAPVDAPLSVEADKVWQVLCGDSSHWRAGVYSPELTSADDIEELERHDCPELFLLLEGEVTLLVADGRKTRQIVLEPGKPVLVKAPHSGFCPKGPHTGRAFVVERDSFDTLYQKVSEWTTRSKV